VPVAPSFTWTRAGGMPRQRLASLGALEPLGAFFWHHVTLRTVSVCRLSGMVYEGD
jgi:hypothetical protein